MGWMPTTIQRLTTVPPTGAAAGRSRCKFLGRIVGATAAGACLVALGVFAGPPLFQDHLQTVLPERVYRSAQMSPERLAETIDRFSIRTVVNLRGPCPDFDWYRHECLVTADAGISQEDVTLSAVRLPPPSELRRLIEILDQADPPLLIHCRQGVDRTGLASAIVTLLQPGSTLEAAERQLSWVFGYVAYNGTEAMRDFLRLYRRWLEEMNREHSPELFRHWATVEYFPGLRRGELECLATAPLRAPADRGWIIPVRATNTSIESWSFRRGVGWGVRLEYHLRDAKRNVVYQGKAGLFERVVPPGQSIELLLGIPPRPPGRYELYADLIAPDGNAFCQFGNDPLIVPITVLPRQD